MTTSARERPARAKRRASASTVASVLASSPSGMRQTSEGTPGSSLDPAGVLIASWVTITADLAAGRQEAGHLVAGARADEDGVGPVGQVDGEGVHGCAHSPAPVRGRRRRDAGPAPRRPGVRGERDASADLVGVRSSTSITTSATSA